MTKPRGETFVSRWGDAELDDRQYARIPGFIMRNYHLFRNQAGEEVGLTPHEFTVMAHLIAFKYDVAEGESSPGLTEIARRMGVDVQSVRRAKKSMEEKGALRVEYRAGETSVYSFPELVRQCRKFEADTITIPQPLSKVTGDTPITFDTPPLSKVTGKEVEEERKGKQPAAGAGDERPNIFAVWEKETGSMLTPGIVDRLKEAVERYGEEWVRDAIKVAVDNNARTWAYIRAVLERWQRDGRDTPKQQSAAAPAATRPPVFTAPAPDAPANTMTPEERRAAVAAARVAVEKGETP